MTRFLVLMFLFLPFIIKAQQYDQNIDQLAKERSTIVQMIDSLEKRLEKIDVQLSQVNSEDRLEAMISKYGKNKGKLIADGKVWVSISFEMARDSWGEPTDIQKTTVSSGTTEKWIYPDNRYLYFKNGRLDSWKD
ncbi:MAG: hypothetical protein KAQ79_23615 [Cyclobacteriaceae bacterium]|nr:hypothetical protein [Cyclobacteriaceae bacterium]